MSSLMKVVSIHIRLGLIGDFCGVTDLDFQDPYPFLDFNVGRTREYVL